MDSVRTLDEIHELIKERRLEEKRLRDNFIMAGPDNIFYITRPLNPEEFRLWYANKQKEWWDDLRNAFGDDLIPCQACKETLRDSSEVMRYANIIYHGKCFFGKGGKYYEILDSGLDGSEYITRIGVDVFGMDLPEYNPLMEQTKDWQ